MNDQRTTPPTGPTGGPADSTNYDRWFDGLLDEAASRRERASVAADPLQRARFEADRAIESSLRRSFGASAPVRPLLVEPAHPAPLRGAKGSWPRYAAAAVLLVVGGALLAIVFERREPKTGGSPLTAASIGTLPSLPLTPVANSLPPKPLGATQFSPGEVFLDALALEFQPLLGCQVQDRWDAELFAQLADAPCNRDQSVVLLGEWIDPRLDVANVLMLRRGENPIMLVVPRCEQETELCVPKDSGLYIHRGMRDGRAIYEISPVPGSEILGCVDAQDVVTQQSL